MHGHITRFQPPEFHGRLFGAVVVKRGIDDDHAIIELYVEDDEVWHQKMAISSAWLDEMIFVLGKLREYFDTRNPDMFKSVQYGWRVTPRLPDKSSREVKPKRPRKAKQKLARRQK